MAKDDLIYMDYNSTTPVDPTVLDAMLPYLRSIYGNAASRSHPFGWQAEAAVTKAREQLAQLLEVQAKEVVFASGATEAVNLAIKGIYRAYATKGNHIITVKTEHKAVLDVCEQLEKEGAKVTYMDVNPDGSIDYNVLEQLITNSTILVAAMWANNETGTIHDMATIGNICSRKGVLLMSDATQAVGKIPVLPREAGVHILALSAHKVYGPKGVGALYVSATDPRIKLPAQLHGGGHERGMRSGTLNVPGIVGLGAAAELAGLYMEAEATSLASLRDRLEAGLLAIEESYLNSSAEHKLSHVTNISFKYIESEALIATFNQTVAVSTGSACTSASLEPSHVLLAQGLPSHMAHSAIRFSLGRLTTEAEIDRTIQLITKGVQALRANSPVWQMYKDGVDVDELL